MTNRIVKNASVLLPRFIRLRDAPFYLGMDRNRFNLEVRPYVDEVSIGKQGIAYDRLDLDAWADDYKTQNVRRGKSQMPSLKEFEEGEFEKALTLARARTRKRT